VDEIDPKLKNWGIALGFLVFALVGVDFVVLKGEPVTSGSLSLQSDSAPLTLSISRPGEEHLVEIRTRKRVRGDDKGQSIAYRLVGPSGMTVVEDSELVSHKKRFFDFIPVQAGEYSLYAEETKLLGSGRGSASVRVTVGDRRVLSRLFRF